jgi:hypothetical protein
MERLYSTTDYSGTQCCWETGITGSLAVTDAALLLVPMDSVTGIGMLAFNPKMKSEELSLAPKHSELEPNYLLAKGDGNARPNCYLIA